MPLLRRRPAAPARVPHAAALATVAVTACGLLSACSSDSAGAAPGTLDLVASTDVWGSVASAVGGDRVTVTSIVSDPDQDPHSFEASSRTLLAVRDADLLIENGGGYDDFMGRLISSSGSSAPVIDAVEVSGLAAPADGELNEHVFYDLPTAERMADRMAVALGAIAPRHAGEFMANARTFDQRVDALIRAERAVHATAAGVGVGITEPVPVYLLQAMGLRNLTPPDFSRAVEDSGDVSTRALAQTLALYTQHRVAALVYNAQTSGPVTTQVEDAAREAGVPVVPVTETLPAGTTYVSWMTHNIRRVSAAVRSR